MNVNGDFETGSDRLKSMDIPEHYFNELEDKVINKWRTNNQETKAIGKKRWLWISGGIAASALLFFSVFRTEQRDIDTLFNDEELAYYYMYTSETIDEDDLLYDFSDIELDDMETWLSNEEFDIEILNELY